MDAQAVGPGAPGRRSPAVLVLPAMGVPGTYYQRLVDSLAAHDLDVTVADFTTSGDHDAAQSRRGGHGYKVLVEQCIPDAYRKAQARSPDKSVLVVGHSLGGQLGLIAAGRYFPNTPIVLIASGTAHFRAFSGARRGLYLVASQVIALSARLFGFWPGDRIGFGGRQSAATMSDWAFNVRTGGYRSSAASFDYDEALTHFRGSVLAIHVQDDRLAPPDATHRLLAKTRFERVTPAAYSSSRAKSHPGSHFTWVRDLPGVAPQIAEWAEQLGTAPRSSEKPLEAE